MERLEKDKLYISFHRPKSVVGLLISAWTLGNYSHCEFIYNDTVYLANPGRRDVHTVLGKTPQKLQAL